MQGNSRPFSIETRRCHIALMSNDDGELYRFLYTDPKTMRRIMPPLAGESSEKSFLSALKYNDSVHGRRYFLTARAKAEHAQVGMGGVCFEQDGKVAEMGVMLLRRFHNKGYFPEIARGISNYLFAHFPIEKLVVDFDPKNLPVLRFIKRMGLQPEDEPENKAGHCRWSIRRENRLHLPD